MTELAPFTTDGCSGGMTYAWKLITSKPPPWQHCCIAHDDAYWRGGTKEERRKADRALRFCVYFNGHPLIANLMYWSVRFGGHPWLPFPWRWGYGYPYGRGYKPWTLTN